MRESERGSPHLNKSCAAGVTAVRLLSGVNARVSLQVGWSIELSTTHITTVRLVNCKRNDHCYLSVQTSKSKPERDIIEIFIKGIYGLT